MRAIEPVDLPEAQMLIGDYWPSGDETAYAREADKHRTSSEQADGARATTHTAALHTTSEFRGAAGTELAEQLTGHGEKHRIDTMRHTNVKDWMLEGQNNLVRTKSAINQAVVDYHDGYSRVSRQAVDESWSQDQLRKAKDNLVSETRERIRQIDATYQSRHAEVRQGVQGGFPVPERHVTPHFPDNQEIVPYACYLGADKNADPAKVCGPLQATHTWYVDNGHFVDIKGSKVEPGADITVNAGPGEVMQTNVDPLGRVAEVKVWLTSPPTAQDFTRWNQNGTVDVNIWYLNPDGSIGVDRRGRTGNIVYQGTIMPGYDWGM